MVLKGLDPIVPVGSYHKQAVKRKRLGHIFWKSALIMLMVVGITFQGFSPTTAFASSECSLLDNNKSSLWITSECNDPLYNQPVIDSQEDLTTPIVHRKVSGHFEGTDKKFNFYFPAKNQWEGRFFQLVYPLQDENATDESITFGAESGAYTVQTNGSGGYRVDAAAAKFSEMVASSYYGSSSRIYGYIYGGSGGSFQTIGAIENSTGVWDGAVPFIIGAPTSIPNTFFIRAFARFVLEDKAPQIADAVSPGGSGNPYTGLNDVEQAVLQEVTKLGIPLNSWEDYHYLLGFGNEKGLLDFESTIRSIDPTYADDFWSKPGYLGTEQSDLGNLYREAKIDYFANIQQVASNSSQRPLSLKLDSAPAGSSKTFLDYTLYAADGVTRIGTVTGTWNPVSKMFTIGSDTTSTVLSAIQPGAKLRIDNRWSLALTSYHRYQVPSRAGFYAWNQFRQEEEPIYPQRSIEIGSLISKSVSGGGTFTGKINGKIIVIGNLLDNDAYPWHADWYSARVKESLGERYDDNFRIWFNDNADHITPGPRTARLIQFDGIVQQALRDLSNWVEKGVAPSQSTRYEVSDGQVKVAENAFQRRGIQPVVDLTVDGKTQINIKAGQKVTFKAEIQVPLGAGKIVGTDWDFDGNGYFKAFTFGKPKETVKISLTHTYPKAGTYFAQLRVTSQREGDTSTPFAKVQNLGRIRVVVQ